MTRYLLDTDALIDFSKGVEPATSMILSWIDGTDEIAVCPITVSEFYASEWAPFVSALTYWDISRGAAMRAGQDRYALGRSGMSSTMTDALIASVAREYRATVVTGNAKHFPMEEVSALTIR